MLMFIPKIPAPLRNTNDNRSGKDRRVWHWGNLVWLFKKGHRRSVRRKTDKHDLRILDYYSPKLFYSMTLVLLLSVGDALLTLWLIDHGAVEFNPVMAYFLQYGPNVFMLAKYLLTVLAVMIVVLLNYAVLRYVNFKFSLLMPLFAGCLAMVVAWELYLLTRLLL